MPQSAIEAALVDPEREPPDLEGVPGWRRLRDGAPHLEDLRDIVDAVLRVTRPERVLLFGSGARGETTEDSDIGRGAPESLPPPPKAAKAEKSWAVNSERTRARSGPLAA